jgi:RNA polymerase sigma-70 factor, ECF subfamily
MPAPSPTSPLAALDDAELAGRIVHRDEAAFEALMRRHNGRLFRVARAILKDDSEAEDALQDAYLDAYRHIADFRGSAQVGTWLTRIVVNQALMRLRRQKSRIVLSFEDWQGEMRAAGRADGRGDIADMGDRAEMADHGSESPATATLRLEIRRMLERKIDELPLAFRTVFVMREVEDMTVEETAAALSIPSATVRTRLFRARALLREALAQEMDSASAGLFSFDGERCDRIVAAVLARARQE